MISTSRAVTKIREALKPPLKEDGGDLREWIVRTIGLGKANVASGIMGAKEVNQRARKYEKALKAIGHKDCPPALATILERYANQRVPVNDDPMGKFCTLEAVQIVVRFSSRSPVVTLNGNVHIIAKIIFEAATGRAPSNAAFLNAVRQEVAARKRSNQPGSK
jgi:hypothetical protein